MGVVTETEIVREARNVIRMGLAKDMYAENHRDQIALAKWVIENIWTPEAA